MEKIYQILPHFFQNILITAYNFFAYQKRYGGKYKKYLTLFKSTSTLPLDALVEIQNKEFKKLINFATTNSTFYTKLYKDIDIATIQTVDDIGQLPLVDKELLRTSTTEAYTISKSDGIISKTGGTTGKSLEIVFTVDDMQKRFAMLDNFRSNFGYRLGEKTAWFSGKNLLTNSDIGKNRFWKTDYLYKVKYYSTFHIKEEYLRHYLDDLIRFQPKFMVGFPSSIIEIARFGIKNKISFPENTITAIFPTAETITEEIRQVIESFFKTKIYDQYASSEGAPFIFQCTKNSLHLELQSGVFEVLNDENKPVSMGKLVVTSFSTYGTPLIRYDIGDSVELSEGQCTCGNNNPLVKQILGRIDDYIYSIQNGKINLGNVSNTLKDTSGIIKFQAIQNQLEAIEIKVVTDKNVFDSKVESIFMKNWRDRVGEGMKIELHYVDDIPVEKSGKYRMVKNNIKHLVDN